MANNTVYNNAWPARGHDNVSLFSDTASAVAAAVLYKGVYFNADGNLDIVDAKGNKETVKALKGVTYRCQTYGAVTGGGTTLSNGDFLLLYD